MADGKKSFIVYSDWKDFFKALTPQQCYDLMNHLLCYVNDENPTLENDSLRPVWALIEPTLKRDLKKWEAQKMQRSEAGKKSAESRQRPSMTVNENQRASTVNVNDNVNVNVTNSCSDRKPFNEAKAFEYLRRAANVIIPDSEIKVQIGMMKNQYENKQIENLAALCNRWASNMKYEKPQTLTVPLTRL
jgi:hypothetical protein